MKTFFLNLLFLIPILSIGQTNYNELTKTEYYDIEVNNVSLEDIIGFQGDINDLSQLFGYTFTNISNDPVGESKVFQNSKINFTYHGFPPQMQLYYFELTDSSIIMEIKGVSINLGDNISILNGLFPSLNTFTTSSGEKKALFKPEYESSYICIEYDATFHVITKIYYLSPT